MLLLPSPQLLAELSHLVKVRRHQIHLSQAELARGICTQTTISTLENGTSFSKWEIIPALLERLKVEQQELEQKFCKQYCYGERQLQALELDLFQFEFKEGARRLAQIKVENLDSKQLLSRYHCYCGLLQLLQQSNFEAAIISFDQALSYPVNNQLTLTQGLAYLGEAATYQRLNFVKRAQLSLHKAFTQLELLLQTEQEALLILMKFGMATTTLGLILKLYPATQRMCQQLRRYLKQHYSYYCLTDFYYLEGLAVQATEQNSVASHLFHQADQVAHLKNNSKLIQVYELYQLKNPQLDC
ncbi:helix-turn-helix domain-containing protein [Fructilactobacillus hinvesii]|uniref:Helix-turn-helix domain-containing protein n=1 Tax=Fructilactobacillus hinvesii TaxID=2940300 RepID=A0ABY5BRE4_9LACO|nr:helix-turn-helix transcriptional regulator [Fructilactobacillus hinvesii]USS87699.1 helix-turn-helix domain-containing protein [Fructilactobacillus hinvesii]